MRLKLSPLSAIILCLSSCNAESESTRNANSKPPKLNHTSSAFTSSPKDKTKAVPSERLQDYAFSKFLGIKVGTSVTELRKQGIAVGDIDYAIYDEGDRPNTSCGYAPLTAYPDVHIMFSHDKVVRIDIESARYATVRGIRIGDTEASALQRLGKAVEIEQHPYGDDTDHYLILHTSDAPFGMIIETWEGKVASYRIGNWEDVQLIEGCS